MKFFAKRIALNLLVYLAVGLISAWFVFPSPDIEYSGWTGLFLGSVHGGLIGPNFIYTFLSPERVLVANIHDTAYIISWWLSVIATIYELILDPLVTYARIKMALKYE